MMAQKRRINKSNKYVGVEGVFYRKEGQSSFRVFKKSMALKIGTNFSETAKKILKRKAKLLGLNFAGISDVFNVDGQPRHKGFLGRTAYYDFTDRKKAKLLLEDFNYLDLESKSSIFFVSLVYFIMERPAKDSFSIIYNIGIKSSGKELKNKIIQIGNSENVKRSIVKMSLDITNVKGIHFIGVRWVEKIESDGFFDSSEAVFKTKRNVLKEIEPMKKIKNKILHLLENDIRLQRKNS